MNFVEIKFQRNNNEFVISSLHHIAHFSNVENILKHGILSHNEAYKRGLIQKDISMAEVQAKRERVPYVNGFPNFRYSIHDLASLYFNSRNPMLYKRKDISNELVIILVNPKILDCKPNDKCFAIFSDGNVASSKTSLFIGVENLPKIPFEDIYINSWYDINPEIKKENSRKICAEVLVYPFVQVKDILEIWCGSEQTFHGVCEIQEKIGKSVAHIEVMSFPEYFAWGYF